jgi:hypothetical protein
MTQSSFYGDTPNYATDFPTQNDGNTQPADGNVQAPSSFYPNGGIYAFLNSSDPLLVQLQGLVDATLANATAAATSAANAAASEATVLAGIAAAAGTATPLVDGTATVGTSTKWAHEDHVHPTDTSRASVTALALKADKTYVDTQDATKADTSYVNTQLALKAPLASPAFTGSPTAPTAAVDNNSTAIATTAYVQQQAGASTPAMDGTASAGSSLKWSRQDHVHPTDTSRAPLASPTFTGTPAAPTPTAGDNTTKVATTAFVTTAIAGVTPPTGAPLKEQQTVDTTNRSTSSTSYAATGSISTAITPQSASNKLRIQVSGVLGASTAIGVHVTLFRSINGGAYTDITPAGSTELQGQVVTGSSFPQPLNIDFIDSPATALPVTYQLYMSVTSAATAYLGRRGSDTVFSSPTVFTITEIKG